MNRARRRRAAALDRKVERVKSRHNELYEQYIKYLPEIAPDEPFRAGEIYHICIHHDPHCAFYRRARLEDCDCCPEITRHIVPVPS